MNHAVSHKWDPCPRRPGRLFVACRSGDEEDKKPVSGDFGGAAWPLWQVMIMNRRACTMMFATAVTLFGVAQAAHAFSLKLVSKKIAAPRHDRASELDDWDCVDVLVDEETFSQAVMS